jgi:hypothetical protein
MMIHWQTSLHPSHEAASFSIRPDNCYHLETQSHQDHREVVSAATTQLATTGAAEQWVVTAMMSKMAKQH